MLKRGYFKMIVKDEFLSKLRRYFGLNLYEVKIWSALLSRGVSTAGELSDIANVPRSRSYDVLESLEKKGFVIVKLGKPIKYIAVEPSEVLERVKKNVQNDAKANLKRLDDLKGTDVIQELNALHKQGVELVEPSDLSGSIRGRHNLYNHLELTIRDAEESVEQTNLFDDSSTVEENNDNLAATFSNQSDAPGCDTCGSVMIRNGACYKCLNCGATSGCS